MILIENQTPAHSLISPASSLPANLASIKVNDHTVNTRSVHVMEWGQRACSMILRVITKLSDDLGMTLEVLPRSAVEHGWWTDDEDYSDALNQDDLEKWCLRHGFDYIRDHDELENDDRMIRKLR
jgi:hypothetical protein